MCRWYLLLLLLLLLSLSLLLPSLLLKFVLLPSVRLIKSLALTLFHWQGNRPSHNQSQSQPPKNSYAVPKEPKIAKKPKLYNKCDFGFIFALNAFAKKSGEETRKNSTDDGLMPWKSMRRLIIIIYIYCYLISVKEIKSWVLDNQYEFSYQFQHFPECFCDSCISNL